MSPHKLVLDTNVVLDLFVFRDRDVRLLASAMESGSAIAITSASCLEELRRVLAYPQLRLDSPARTDAFEAYRRQAELFDMPEPAAGAGLPQCPDPDDQKFLDLAWQSNASWLISRDKSLLRTGRRFSRLGRFTVIRPQDYVATS